MLIDLGKESRHNRRLKPFSLPASVEVSNTLSEKFTVIEVMGLDRTGLLHQLTRAISDLNLTIGSAHIGTYGEKAVDVFYVTDLTGHKIDNAAPPEDHPRHAARRLPATCLAPARRAGAESGQWVRRLRRSSSRPPGTGSPAGAG